MCRQLQVIGPAMHATSVQLQIALAVMPQASFNAPRCEIVRLCTQLGDWAATAC